MIFQIFLAIISILFLYRILSLPDIYLGENYIPNIPFKSFRSYRSPNKHKYLAQNSLVLQLDHQDNQEEGQLYTCPKQYIPNSYHYIQTQPQLKTIINHLRQSKIIGVDIQCSLDNSYYGHISLIQISSVIAPPIQFSSQSDCKTQIYLIDTQTIRQPLLSSQLKLLFQDPIIIKVLHGCSADLNWLKRDLNSRIANLFDVQRFYMTLYNIKQNPSLTILWERYCKFKMLQETKKLFQKSSWEIRPLDPDQLNYAALDSYYLLHIRESLIKQALQSHSEEQIINMIQQMQGITRINFPISSIHSRKYKEFYNLHSFKFEAQESLHIEYTFKKLFEFRDSLAKEYNKNPNKLLDTGSLYSLASQAPKTQKDLLKVFLDAGSPINQQIILKRLSAILKLIKTSRQQIDLDLIMKEIQEDQSSKSDQVSYRKRLSKQKKIQIQQRKQQRRKKVVKQFSCRGPVYQNCKMLAPDGQLLCHCDEKKAMWYAE